MTELEEKYRTRYTQFLVPTAERLESFLRGIVSERPRVDRVAARAKGIDRFLKKAAKTENGKLKYADPLNQIQDQIGARIVTFYPLDVPPIADVVTQYFRAIESKMIIPDGENEFGYEGRHFIVLLPSDVTSGFESNDDRPDFFELQIKTLFQHAWGEAEHDLGYKPSNILSSLQKRKMAFTAAQAWGADQIFNELFEELQK